MLKSLSKLSIISINLNNGKGLAKTIQSVIRQSYKNFDFIIIDGGSTDMSKTIIQSHEPYINYWVSEPDEGIYHAMNKGIQLADSEYCLFLNSGDWLAESTTLENVFALNPHADIVAGDINYFDTKLNEIKWHVPSPDILTAKTLFIGTLPHQATFIKRALFDKVGFYNEKLKIASDWLFFLDALLIHQATYQHYRGTIAYFNMDGISCSTTTDFLPGQEKINILQERYPFFISDYNYLNELENQSKQWQASKEFKVYKYLRDIGVISLGVQIDRVIRFLKRFL